MNTIKEQYEKVFDQDWNIRNCTRVECMKLIEMLGEKFPDEDFGNDKTRFLNTEHIRKLMAQI